MREAGAMTLETAGLLPARPGGHAFDLDVVADITVPAFASNVAMARISPPPGPNPFAPAEAAQW